MKNLGRYFLLVVGNAAGFAVLLLTACAILQHPAPAPKTPAYHGNVADAGILELTAGGARIDAQARAAYNGLVARYGARFNPPVSVDAGVVLTIGPALVPAIWIDKEHLHDWAVMQFWADNPAFIPPGPPPAPQPLP